MQGCHLRVNRRATVSFFKNLRIWIVSFEPLTFIPSVNGVTRAGIVKASDRVKNIQIPRIKLESERKKAVDVRKDRPRDYILQVRSDENN